MPQNSVRDAKYPKFFKVKKYDTSDNSKVRSDFPTLGGIPRAPETADAVDFRHNPVTLLLSS